MQKTILIAGGTGGVGRLIAAKLIQRGIRPRLLVRDIPRARQLFGDQADYAAADLRLPGSLPAALSGARAVLCATGSSSPTGDNRPERVDYEGVRNLAEAARQASIEHFILVSSIAVTQPDHPLNRFGRVLDWKLKGENALRASGVPYTIIRPGGLTDADGGKEALRLEQGDRIQGMISRMDVAEACLQALEHGEAAKNKTFEVIAEAGSSGSAWSSRDWEQAFQRLQPDELSV